MPKSELTKQNILDALKYIDKNKIFKSYASEQDVLIDENGTKYPPKYVLTLADHLTNGTDLANPSFNNEKAKEILIHLGFHLQTKQQENYQLTISADRIESTDERFLMDDLSLGNHYKPIDAYFKKADGTITKRTYNKGEKRITNQTLPRIAFQIFDQQLASLSQREKENFPICKYQKDKETIRGIFDNIDEFKKQRNSLESVIYDDGHGYHFVIYCWNIFSTLLFVQECLKRFGQPNDQFILVYREKEEKESSKTEDQKEDIQEHKGYQIPYSSMLIESKNLIFRGAPGTGKSYLAKQIAADLISDGQFKDFDQLSNEQKKQVEFVQFHPNYDYSDFVEGLKPKVNEDGSMGFELQDGIFKKFVLRARKNYENSQKSNRVIQNELSVQEKMSQFFSNIEFGVDTFTTLSGNKFTINSMNDDHLYISIPHNATTNKLTLNLDEIRKMLESKQKFEKVKDITNFFGKNFATQGFSYDLSLYKAIQATKTATSKVKPKQEELKKYIFIIDEINRGEISKIFGELFFSIDPGYRGKAGEISTQYSNMHPNPEDKFYIPENVYIIATMNDIDRSVDSFDFAMRRRFRFIELRANECIDMLDTLENEILKSEAIRRMIALNKEIAATEDLNENYQIGASYFLKLKTLSFDQLWTDYLQPLLQEYIHGLYDEKAILQRFAKAYGYAISNRNLYESTEDQR